MKTVSRLLSLAPRSSTSSLNWMNYDFCPWANRYVYWLKRPIGWLVLGGVASLLLGVFVAPKALFAAVAIGGLTIIGCCWPMMAVKGLQGDLTWGLERCEEGQSISVKMTLINRLPFPLWGLVLETDSQIASSEQFENESRGFNAKPVALSRVSPLVQSEFTWNCRPVTRGVFPRQGTWISTSFPFGIWTARRELKVPRRLKVWPRTCQLIDMPEFSGRMAAVAGAMSPRVGQEGDWSGVRAYREGDSLRHVHWALSARCDNLVVCERESSSRQHVTVWLDPYSSDQNQQDQESEWLLRVLATLSKHFANHHWSGHCWIGTQAVALNSTSSSMCRWMDQLAAFRWPFLSSESLSSSSSEIGLSQSLQHFQGIWWIGLTCAARYQQLVKQVRMSARRSPWIVLRTESTLHECAKTFASNVSIPSMPDEGVCMALSAPTDAASRDPLQQLQLAWRHLCQDVRRCG